MHKKLLNLCLCIFVYFSVDVTLPTECFMSSLPALPLYSLTLWAPQLADRHLTLLLSLGFLCDFCGDQAMQHDIQSYLLFCCYLGSDFSVIVQF